MDRPEHLLPSRADQIVILVADDEPMIRNIARIVLEDEGYFILAADDGEEALFPSRAFPGAIHLLVTDVMMPKLDGWGLTKQIRKERPSTKVLVMSGDFETVSGEAFLAKPFTVEVLRQRVAEILSPLELG